jgi:hypothetical protein
MSRALGDLGLLRLAPNVKLAPMHPEISDIIVATTNMERIAVAKGQKRSNREVKKPKKTAAERLKVSQVAAVRQTARMGGKDAARKG